jgi:hypothetical protein
MDRFSILLKKVPKKSKRKREIRIPYQIIPAPPGFSPWQRGILVQTLHPKNGDIFIFSLPGADQEEIDNFLKIIHKEFKDLNKSCSAIAHGF